MAYIICERSTDDDEHETLEATQRMMLHRNTISNIPSLVCAFSASATTGGTAYAFGLYSAALKRNLQLTQGQMNSISTAFFVAGLFTWIPGLCSDRFGTRFALSLGGCTGAVTLLLYWAVAREFIEIQRGYLVLVLSTLGVFTFLSCGLVTGAIFKILVAACGPGTKGSAVGVAKAYVGLGAGLYACIFQAFREEGESDLDFLPMAAFFFITCATIPALMLLPSKQDLQTHDYKDECNGRHFRTLYLSLLIMAVLIVADSMMKLYDSTPELSVTATAAQDNDVNKEAEQTSGPNYGLGLMLITIWLGPIVSLEYLPRNLNFQPNASTALPGSSKRDENDIEMEEDSSVRRRKCRDAQKVARSKSDTHADVPVQTKSRVKRDRPIRSNSLTRRDGIVLVPPSPPKSGGAANSWSPPKATPIKLSNEEKRGLLVADVTFDADNDMEADILLDRVTHKKFTEEDESNLNMFQMLQTPTAWLMLWTTTILVGAGTVETNNMGQMVEALGFPSSVTPASLAFFSVAQAAARVFTGSISESALDWNTRMFCIENGVPRPFFLFVASLVGFVAHFMLGLATGQFAFVVGATLAGVAFGMLWPLMVLISGEVFGTANAGANYMFYDGVSSAGGTLLLTKFIAQEVYESHTDSSGPDRNTCVGMKCFQSTHMIVACLSLTCVLSSIALLYTTRTVYNKASLHAA